METGNTCYADLDKLTSSVEILSSIDDCISHKDLAEAFYDIEAYLNRINFEHGNCITFYKDFLSFISEELIDIKKDINELDYALEKTTSEFTDSEEKTVQEVLDLSEYYGNSVSQKLGETIQEKVISSMGGAMDSGNSNDVVSTTGGNINTVPIGVGIATAGILASAAAIIIDDQKRKQNSKIGDYHPEENVKTVKTEPESDADYYIGKPINKFNSEAFDETVPYEAVRNQDERSKFYAEKDNWQDEEKY